MKDPRVLCGLALAVGFALLGLLPPRPAVDNSVAGWLHSERPSVTAYADFRRRFGSDEVYVARLEGADRTALLEQVRAVEAAFLADPLIEHVLGPGSAFADEVEVLLDPDLADAVTVAGMRFDTPLNARLDLLRLDPPRATIFALGRVAPPAARESLDAALVAARAKASAAGVTLRVAGSPALNLALDRAGRQVQTHALPLLVGVCVVLLLVATRSIILTLSALACVGLAVLATQGALGLSGQSSNLVVDIAQPLVFVLLLASAMHLLTGWQDARHAGADPRSAPWDAVRAKGKAIALALGTTAIGFASLGVADLLPIRCFGLLSAGGLALGLGTILLVLPAVLSLLGRWARVRAVGQAGRLAESAVRFGLRWRAPMVLLGLGVIAAGAASYPQLRTDPHAIRYFDADHPLRRDHEAIEAAGLGLSTVEVVLSAPDGMLSAGRLDQVDAFASHLADLGGVQRVMGATTLLRDASVRAGGIDAIPAGPVIEDARQATGVTQFIAADGRSLRFALLIGTLDADALDRLRAQIHREAETLSGVDVLVTGNYGLLLEAQRSLLGTLTWSLLLTAGLIELLILIGLRSVRLALAAILPNAVPVAVNFSVMILLDIPLDVGTCMTAAVALGIAVDDTLHMLVAWRAAPGSVARSTGRALIWTTVIIGAGFFALLSADFGPTRHFGLLCATAMIAAVLADLLVLPALLGPGVPPDNSPR